ncbi:MAG: permease prefix domain 1-containing protein [Clostridiales bacterium]|nr:permease prefix domain 1-containing protein [Clostridiales bacterium]
MMNEKIAQHVGELFAGAPPEPEVLEIKEELLANLNEKYLDLLTEGKSEDAAYSLVISGIGDIQDLLRDFTACGPYNTAEIEKMRNAKSIYISLGAAIYVLSLAVLLLFAWFRLVHAGLAVTILCWAVATGLVVYGINLGRTSYSKRNDSFVEQYKEKIAAKESKNSLKKAVNSAIWPMVLVIYLATSFITDRWDITWIIFIIAVSLQQFIHWRLFARPEEKGKYWYGIFWSAIIAFYFIISFAFMAWAWSWMIFIAALAAQQIIMLLRMWRNKV